MQLRRRRGHAIPVVVHARVLSSRILGLGSAHAEMGLLLVPRVSTLRG